MGEHTPITAPSSLTKRIFREEAIQHRQAASARDGSLLRIAPEWSRWAYAVLLPVVGSGLLYASFGTIDEYATGPAVIRTDAPTQRRCVLAALPASYGPLFGPGKKLRLELSGFRYAYQELTIDSAGDQALGPAGIRRLLGDDTADALHVDGPVILVRAQLPSRSFDAGGHEYPYLDGMLGIAEVRVGSERLLLTLIPALGSLWGGAR